MLSKQLGRNVCASWCKIKKKNKTGKYKSEFNHGVKHIVKNEKFSKNVRRRVENFHNLFSSSPYMGKACCIENVHKSSFPQVNYMCAAAFTKTFQMFVLVDRKKFLLFLVTQLLYKKTFVCIIPFQNHVPLKISLIYGSSITSKEDRLLAHCPASAKRP